MDFLASDALRGRGSGTQEEWIAATYIASELTLYGVPPAGDGGGYIQRATLLRRQVTGPPQLTMKPTGGTDNEQQTWTHGKEFLVLHLGSTSFSGPLEKVSASDTTKKIAIGSVVFVSGKTTNLEEAAFQYASQGAVAVIIAASDRLQAWSWATAWLRV